MNKCLHIFIGFNIQLNYNIKSTYTVGIKPVIIWLNNVCSPQWLKKVIKGMNTWKRRENNRRKRKTGQRDNSTNKMKSVCVYVLCYPDNMCVWVCVFESVTAWLTDWPTEAGRDERKVRRCQAELRNTHPTESISTLWLNMDQRFSLCLWAWNKMRHVYDQVRSCLAQIFLRVSRNVSINYREPEGRKCVGVQKRLSPQ